MQSLTSSFVRLSLRRPLPLPSSVRPASLPSTSRSSPLRSFSSTPSAPATLSQVIRGARKPLKKNPNRAPALQACFQKKGVCSKVYTVKPKKPNSAVRKVAKVKLTTGKAVIAYIPGEGHNLQEHSVVLVRGGRTQDIPGCKYKIVRGALDLNGVAGRQRSRSKYGSPYTLNNDLWGMSTGSGSQTTTKGAVNGSVVAWSTEYDWSGGSGDVKSYAHVAVTEGLGHPLSSISTIPTVYDWYYKSPSSDLVADVYSFVATEEIAKYDADLMQFFTYLINNEGVSSAQYLTGVQAGTEPFTGSATLEVAAFSAYVVHGDFSTSSSSLAASSTSTASSTTQVETTTSAASSESTTPTSTPPDATSSPSLNTTFSTTTTTSADTSSTTTHGARPSTSHSGGQGWHHVPKGYWNRV
ncbi:hypothetical protein MNV49_003180 [Pseudohyphozyma bogoriensis]|nr:hypothetical protein MNV49_003180 [Pseudohyphozyma bogoriensis]